MSAAVKGPASGSFVNRVERDVLVLAFGLLGCVMLTGVWAASSAGSRIAAAIAAAVFALLAARSWRRPRVTVTASEIVVRSAVINRSIRRDALQAAAMAEARVGAFRRSVVVLSRGDGTQVNLGRWGIWASRGSTDEDRLAALVERINSVEPQ
jgi:hypothetical protein